MATYPMLLVTLCVFMTALAKADFQTCCPTCSTDAIDSLNDDQMQQFQNNSAFIQELERNPMLLLNDTNQREIVNLTEAQEEQMLRNFPQLFQSAEAFAQSQATSGVVTVPGSGSTRKRRQASGARICPPRSQSVPLILFNKPNGDVVQLAQPSGVKQWILKEDCESTSPNIMGVQCGVVSRHVPALFINLSEIERTGGSSKDFDFNDVVVQSCVTIRL
ncbi:uncharacterized protein LOC119719118 [Patiria miniata]|uniref:Uncharacterized protein n=1 Tax=Patiria miniata TaxID=46514 RepID=A0A913Z052_PATMI|nr:uncharacterized protein LOC119719118 [Patiria miniata]